MQMPSKYIVNALIENRIISEEDSEIYLFGTHQIFVTVLNLATAIFVGLLAGMLWETILFLGAYIPLRKFAGGFHAKTEVRCYFVSTFLLLAALGFLRYIKWETDITLLLLTLAFTTILFLAPVDNSNKPLDQEERHVFRFRSKIIVTAHAVFALCFLLVEMTEAITVISVADATLAIMMVLGSVKNRITVNDT